MILHSKQLWFDYETNNINICFVFTDLCACFVMCTYLNVPRAKTYPKGCADVLRFHKKMIGFCCEEGQKKALK